jgi:hypothetical protein
MTISSQTRQAGPFTGNGATTAFPFAFKVFTAADLVVVRTDLSGVDSTLVLGTDYSVALNADQNANPGGTITLPVALASGFKLTATSGLANLQPTDLTNQGGFYPAVINNALDRLTILVQQLANGLARSLKFPISDGTDGNPTMPGKDLRKGRVLAFHETTGDPVQGPSIADVNTVAGNIASINTVSTNIVDVVAVADNMADVNTVAANIANVNTVAANIADVVAVADDIVDVNTVADNLVDVTNFAGVYYGGSTSDPATRRDGSPLQNGDLYFNTSTSRLRVFSETAGVWLEGNAGSVAVQNLSGDGVETEFALATAPVSENNTQVYIGGVYQQKDQYSISGTTLTFTSAPPSGTNNIEVVTLNTLPLGVTSADLVQFQPAGTGAVLRTVEDALRDLVSVKSFVTGLNDAAFQAAIDSLPTNGGMVFVPPGNYTFSNTVNLRSGVYLMGMGGRDGVRITANGITALSAVNTVQVRIDNLRLYSNRTPDTWGIYVENNPRGIHIENVYADGFGNQLQGGGFRVWNESWGSRLIGLAAERCGYGIRINAGASVIVGAGLRQLSGPGLFIEGGNGYHISGGVIEKTRDSDGAAAGTGYSIIVQNGKRVVISGLYSEQSRDGLIKLDSTNGVCIQGCFIDGVANAALDFGLLYFTNSSNCVVEGNSIRGLDSTLGTGKAVIYFDATSNNNVVMGNQLESDGNLGAGNSTVIDLGTGNVYINNTGPTLATENRNGITAIGQPIRSASVDVTSYFGGRLDQANVGPELILQNGYNNSATNTGSAIRFRGTAATRQFTIRSSSTGTFTRSPALIFESENDGGGVAERFRINPSGSVRFVSLASAPAGPAAGDVYYDSSTNKLRCYNGTSWNDLF